MARKLDALLAALKPVRKALKVPKAAAANKQQQQEPQKPRIKKPINAYAYFVAENRGVFVEKVGSGIPPLNTSAF